MSQTNRVDDRETLEFELAEQRSMSTDRARVAAAWAAGILGVVLLVLLAVAAIEARWDELWARLWPAFQANPWRVLFKGRVIEIAVLAIGFAVALRARRRARIVLTRDEIKVVTGVPWLGSALGLDWAEQLSDIREAVVVRGNRLVSNWMATRLRLTVGDRKRVLQPALWAARDEVPDWLRPGFLGWSRPKASGVRIDALPLIAALRERGVEVVLPPDSGNERDVQDLARYPLVLALVLASVGFGLYFFLDAVFLREYYLLGPSLASLALLGLLATTLALMALARSSSASLALPVRGVVALFLGVTVAMAAHPGVLRLGQIVGESEPLVFIADGYGGLSPADPAAALPSWRPRQSPDFWAARAAGERIELNVRRGVFGFWQYDVLPIQTEVSRFYGTRPRGARGTRSR